MSRPTRHPCPWRNLTLCQATLADLAAAFKITHVQTGRYFIGSSGNCYNYFHSAATFMRAGTMKVKSLQELFALDPNFLVELVSFGQASRMEERAHGRRRAQAHAELWVQQVMHDPLCVNAGYSTPRAGNRKPARKVSQRPRVVRAAATSPVVLRGSLFPV